MITATSSYINTTEQKQTTNQQIQQFYNQATADYLFWDKNRNMHFGYCKSGREIVNRELMIENMNALVFQQFERKEGHFADLGCGMGGAMSYGTENFPNLKFTGYTLSEFQVDFGNHFLNDRAEIKLGNYEQLASASNRFDGAIAIESFCHSGSSKQALSEAFRVLKPGAKLVIADGFLKRKKQSILAKKLHQGLCENWMLKELGVLAVVQENLKEIGFTNITVREISWRVAPSVLYVPFLVIQFAWQKFKAEKKLSQASIHNLKGSVYSLLSGLFRREFGYYLISAEK